MSCASTARPAALSFSIVGICTSLTSLGAHSPKLGSNTPRTISAHPSRSHNGRSIATTPNSIPIGSIEVEIMTVDELIKALQATSLHANGVYLSYEDDGLYPVQFTRVSVDSGGDVLLSVDTLLCYDPDTGYSS
jgi:hypothetical protein